MYPTYDEYRKKKDELIRCENERRAQLIMKRIEDIKKNLKGACHG